MRLIRMLPSRAFIAALAALAACVALPTAALAHARPHVRAGARTRSSAGPGSGSGGAAGSSGGAGLGAPKLPPSTRAHPMVAGARARIVHGMAYAPAAAPAAVKAAIWAGNRIRHLPYVRGGGHGRWRSSGYDCSGSVSYVLHAAHLLDTPEDSGELESFGRPGAGDWITVYTNPSHAFVEIAGIRLDTSAEDDPDPPPGTGPRWRPVMDDTDGYVARHPGDY